MDRRLLIGSIALGLFAADSARANVVGSDTQNFNPAAHRTDYVTVQSAGTLPQGRFSLGLFANGAVNSLPYERGEGQHRGRINDTLTGMDAVIGAGVGWGLELGIALPFVAHQSVEDDKTRGEFAERGNTGARLSGKWRMVESGGFGLATIVTGSVGRTQEDPYLGTGGSPIYHLELAADQALARGVKAGVNLGYRFREPGERIDDALVEPMTDQLIASAAVAVPLAPRWTAVGEVYGSRPTGEPKESTDRSSSNAEALGGVRYAWTKELTMHAGIGTELMQGLSTPDWRAYAGLVTELGVDPKGPGRTVVRKKPKKQRPPVEPASYEPPAVDYPEIPEEAPDEVFILRNINFEFDSDHRVLPGAFNELDKLARYLSKRPYSKIVVEGHTDYMGTDEYNDDLSNRRAKTVRRRLIKTHGMDPARVVSVGYGERRPLTDDTSDAGRQENRRVEIKIYRD